MSSWTRLARRSYVRARQHAGKPGVRVDVVELSGGDEAQIAAVRRPPSSAPAKVQFSHPTGTARSSRSAAFSDLQSRPSSGKRPNASQLLRQQFIALVMSLFQERLARCSYNYSSSSTIGGRLHFWRARKCSYAVKPLIFELGGEQHIDALDRLGRDRRFAEPREINNSHLPCAQRGLDDRQPLRLTS